jgi:rod shape determining protein RodA
MTTLISDHRQQTLGTMAFMLRSLHLDSILLAAIICILTIGLAALYSAVGQNTDIIFSQFMRICAGLAAMLIMAQVSPDLLRRFTPWIFCTGLILLILVLVTGDVGKGAQRWLNIGIRFQPSEIIKLGLPMMLAYLLHNRPLPPAFGLIVVSLIIIFVPVGLVAVQPDLGTAILIVLSGASVIFLAGIGARYLMGAITTALISMPLLWYFVMHDYQKNRVLTLLNPDNDPLGTGYHIIQSKIAIGSGGLFGKGWLNGSQGQLEFLPERSTDFIFAVIGEEFGLMGVLVILLIFLFIVGRGLYIAATAQDTYSRLVAGSISLTFFFYVFVNMSMVAGLLPVVGVPLPLISAGGTSMVTLLAGFGILMSIHTHRKLLPR